MFRRVIAVKHLLYVSDLSKQISESCLHNERTQGLYAVVQGTAQWGTLLVARLAVGWERTYVEGRPHLEPPDAAEGKWQSAPTGMERGP
jgi:hypothetical protein